MKKNRMVIRFMTFSITYLSFMSLSAQRSLDSLEHVMDQNYKPFILGFSEKGKYVTVQKRYGRSNDTITVFDTKGKGRTVGDIINYKVGQVFLGDDAVFSTDPNKAEYWNLKTNRRQRYDNIKRSCVLPEARTYSILDSDNTITVYNHLGLKLYSLNDVVGNPVTDYLKNNYIIIKKRELYEIYDVSKEQPQKVYVSRNMLDHLMLSDAKNYLIAVEIESENKGSAGIAKLTVVHTAKGTVVKSSIGGWNHYENPNFIEFDNGSSLLMNSTQMIPKSKTMEIWYGNDGDLNRNQSGSDRINRYRVIKTNSGVVQDIPAGDFTNMIPTGNDRHILTFKSGALQNYESLWENADMNVYDLKTGKFAKLDIVKMLELYLSKKGNFITYKNVDNNWVIADLMTGKKNIISHQSLGLYSGNMRNPVFTNSDQDIYFESKIGLFVYSTSLNTLKLIPETENKEIKILNRTREIFDAGSGAFTRLTLPYKEPVIVEMTEKEENKTSYLKLKNYKIKKLLPSTGNKITSIYFTQNFNQSVYVEENYTVRPKLIFRDITKSKATVISESNLNDHRSQLFKLEVIRYTNSEGKPLKGLLYYPAGFEPDKKYPMVVRIYQVQSKTSNEFHIVGYNNPPAYDLKRLVESGYFVYLPDIVFGKKGTGLSALDCVNSALDAIQHRPYINTDKIGLTGHSHGGYETNFIATHSTRFAAYLSGAGNSDIVRSYFSYNYNFHSPFYWQFENGQYEMPSPFSENKELYFRNSPIHYAEKVNAPILLWAGKKDRNIAWDQVMEFFIGLKRHRKNVIALFYPNQGHTTGNTTCEGKDLYQKNMEWWDYFLKDKKEVPWINKQMKKDAF
ncbi:alpha/beta hydrolase family protein [Chryseobacterium aquaticum]|nr:prolyl oligopeptidase family serine peptidase [Chryseobacterium aquaticum]